MRLFPISTEADKQTFEVQISLRLAIQIKMLQNELLVRKKTRNFNELNHETLSTHLKIDKCDILKLYPTDYPTNKQVQWVQQRNHERGEE